MRQTRKSHVVSSAICVIIRVGSLWVSKNQSRKPLRPLLIPSKYSSNISYLSTEVWASIEELQTICSKTHEEFMQLLHSMFTALLNCIEGSQQQNAVFMEVLETVQSVRMVS